MKKINNQKGQAVFEFILFMPFLMFLYMIFYTVGNSLNGSINQQKPVRGYYYHLVKGNSYLLTVADLSSFGKKSIEKVGFMAIAYKEHGVGETKQFGTCFKFSSMLKGNSSEECDSPERDSEDSSMYIRLFNAYGVCGPIFVATKTPEKYGYSQQLQTTETCSLK